jgi:ubiquinol-cytochrome c reductase cytochrome b subunit
MSGGSASRSAYLRRWSFRGNMISKIRQWIEGRWPLTSVKSLLLDEEIAGGSSFAYTLGSAALIIFSLQAVSGIVQLFFYVPATDHAYDSISYLRTRVPFGWLIHGLHYWGAQLMIILVLLHILRVFLWGAYKKPRELTWLMGLALLLATMGFSFTGSPLHWDQRGYWIGEVSTSVPGTIPLVGDFMKRLMRGGEEMGQLALSRLFIVHTALLPAVFIPLFAVHIIAMRYFGESGPWSEKKRKAKGLFWPDQVFKDAITGSLILLVLITLAVFLPPLYSGPADPLDLSYIPKPDWNFLFLYESLKYFQGKLEPVGAVGVPTLLIGILFLLPLFDRNPERNPFKRPRVVAGAIILGALIVALSIKGYLSPGFAQAPAAPRSIAHDEGSEANDSVRRVSLVYIGEALQPAPESGGERQQKVAERPHPVSGKDLPGRAAYVIGGAKRGAKLFAQNCAACHGHEGKSILPNPGSAEGKVPDLNPIDRDLYDSDPQSFAENIDRYIQHGSVPEGKSPAIRMPAFGETNSLTQPEIANIEAYVMSLNGVDSARPLNPGMEPVKFYILVLSVYVLVALGLAGLWNKRLGNVM